MNQTSEVTPSAELGTLEQRVAAVHDELRSEQLSPEPAVDAVDDAPPADPASPAGSADTAPATSAAEDRKRRLAELSEAESKKIAKKQRQAEADKLAKELAETRQRAEAAEARAASLVDPDSLDEAAFFRLAHAKGIGPEKLGAWIREAMTNPERIAEATAQEAARKVVDPKLSELEKRLMKAEQELEAERNNRTLAEQRAIELQAAQEFESFTKNNAGTSPYAARYLAKRGSDAFYALATHAAQNVPEGSGWQAVLDHIEESLSGFADIYGTDPSNASAAKPPITKTAAAKANTVSNALAQNRASVVEETDWADLPLEERVARLKAAR